jgi:hypothetical protein
MRNFLALGLLCFFLISCKSKGVPKEFIQPDKMTKILIDIHIADSYISTMTKPDSAKKVSAAYYKGIYKKFNVDSVSYTRSMDYYYKHPDMLTGIYDDVKKDLEKTKAKLEKVPSKPVLKKNDISR